MRRFKTMLGRWRIVLTFAVAVSLTGCGGGSEQSQTPAETPAESQMAAPASEPAAETMTDTTAAAGEGMEKEAPATQPAGN
jgi:hypothetical protein